MNVLVFGTKSYDKSSFNSILSDYPELKVDFTETNLTPLTATLAQGYDAVCAFVNADISAMTLEVLRGLGVGLILMRCAGFDAVNVDYDTLYARADLISLHAFLNEDSYHMINDESIAKMKDGVIFVNTGRGGLVDSNALIRGIRSGKIGAAGLDVYEEENANVYQDREDQILGSSITARLCSFPNVVMTSHQAFFTKEALGQIAKVTLQNARAFANGTDFVERSVVC